MPRLHEPVRGVASMTSPSTITSGVHGEHLLAGERAVGAAGRRSYSRGRDSRSDRSVRVRERVPDRLGRGLDVDRVGLRRHGVSSPSSSFLPLVASPLRRAAPRTHRRHPAGVAAAGIARAACQPAHRPRAREQPADVVRWLGALQAQDYGQSLWAIGSRLRAGRPEVERAIEQRQIVRTWLMRGTIHFAAPRGRALAARAVQPAPAAAEARRCAQLGLTRPTSSAAPSCSSRGARRRPAPEPARGHAAARGARASRPRGTRVPHPRPAGQATR